MDTKILVTYATTHGSTREVAEQIAATLREGGAVVEVQPARGVRSLEGYRAVVLGAPLYMFRLHGDARRFLRRNRKSLTGGLPIAIFAGGPFGKGNEAEWSEVRKEVDKEMAKFPWLKPVAVQVVGGKFDPNHLRFPWSLLVGLKAVPANDLRDWDAIRAWAEGLAQAFSAARPAAAAQRAA